MKLLHVLTLRLSLTGAVIFAFWAMLFYFAIIDEINNEVDDALEDHAEMLIRRALAGEPLNTLPNHTNNMFHMYEVSADYAMSHSHIRYADSEMFIEERNEVEPARTISYIFNDGDGRFFELMVYTPTIDKDDLKAAVAYGLVALYGALALCIALTNLRVLRKSMRPLHSMLAWLDSYRMGESHRPLPANTHIEEFAKLSHALQRSMERNERQFEQQKLFTANASHEMQTPLAVIQNRLEMLLDDGGLSERQTGEVVKALHTLKSLSRTNRSLLLLCKIDNGQFTRTEKVDIGGVARRLLPDMQTMFSHKGMAVDAGYDGTLAVEMDGQLGTTLVANLLKNAFIHGDRGGRIVVRVSAKGLTVANTGTDSPLDGEKIFERFYHSPEKTSSSGLGLSIVKAICQLYGMGIAYSFEQGMHTFRVTPPKGHRP